MALGLSAFWLYPRPGELPTPSYVTLTVNSTFPIGIINYSVASQVHPRFTVAKITVVLQLSSLHAPASSPTATVDVTSPNSIPFNKCPTTVCAFAPRANVLGKMLLFEPRPGATATATFQVRAEDFGETFNGITASAAIPQVFYQCHEVLGCPPANPPQLEARYNLPSPKNYDWASFPTQLEKPTYAVWNEQVTGGEVAGRAAVGIDHDNQQWNDDKTFAAGALIGLAGAALLSAAQEWLHAKD
jgi:hypothetical protein